MFSNLNATFCTYPVECHHFQPAGVLLTPVSVMDTLASWFCSFRTFNQHAFSSFSYSLWEQNRGWAAVGSFPLSSPAWVVNLEGREAEQFTVPSSRPMARGMAEEGKWYQNREIIRGSHRKTFCLQSDYRAEGKFWGRLCRLPASSAHTHTHTPRSCGQPTLHHSLKWQRHLTDRAPSHGPVCP